MPKPSLSLPPLTGIQDRNVQSALQAIAVWARATTESYVAKDELNVTTQSLKKAFTDYSTREDGVRSLTLRSLMDFLQSSAASILANSPYLIQTDMAPDRGVKIGRAGIVGFNSSGYATFTIDARTGDATFYGTVTGGSIEGATNVSSAGYIYATGVNLEKLIEFRPGLVYHGVIVGESEDATEDHRIGVSGITRGAESIGVAGYASGAKSFGGAFIGTDAGIYAGGVAGGRAAMLDGDVDVTRMLRVANNVTVSGGGRYYWKNEDDGIVYDVIERIYTLEQGKFSGNVTVSNGGRYYWKNEDDGITYDMVEAIYALQNGNYSGSITVSGGGRYYWKNEDDGITYDVIDRIFELEQGHFSNSVTVSGGGRFYWKNEDDGITYDVIDRIFELEQGHFGNDVTVSDGGRFFWKNEDDGITYDVIQYSFDTRVVAEQALALIADMKANGFLISGGNLELSDGVSLISAGYNLSHLLENIFSRLGALDGQMPPPPG